MSFYLKDEQEVGVANKTACECRNVWCRANEIRRKDTGCNDTTRTTTGSTKEEAIVRRVEVGLTKRSVGKRTSNGKKGKSREVV